MVPGARRLLKGAVVVVVVDQDLENERYPGRGETPRMSASVLQDREYQALYRTRNTCSAVAAWRGIRSATSSETGLAIATL